MKTDDFVRAIKHPVDSPTVIVYQWLQNRDPDFLYPDLWAVDAGCEEIRETQEKRPDVKIDKTYVVDVFEPAFQSNAAHRLGEKLEKQVMDKIVETEFCFLLQAFLKKVNWDVIALTYVEDNWKAIIERAFPE